MLSLLQLLLLFVASILSVSVLYVATSRNLALTQRVGVLLFCTTYIGLHLYFRCYDCESGKRREGTELRKVDETKSDGTEKKKKNTQ